MKNKLMVTWTTDNKKIILNIEVSYTKELLNNWAKSSKPLMTFI